MVAPALPYRHRLPVPSLRPLDTAHAGSSPEGGEERLFLHLEHRTGTCRQPHLTDDAAARWQNGGRNSKRRKHLRRQAFPFHPPLASRCPTHQSLRGANTPIRRPPQTAVDQEHSPSVLHRPHDQSHHSEPTRQRRGRPVRGQRWRRVVQHGQGHTEQPRQRAHPRHQGRLGCPARPRRGEWHCVYVPRQRHRGSISPRQ